MPAVDPGLQAGSSRISPSARLIPAAEPTLDAGALQGRGAGTWGWVRAEAQGGAGGGPGRARAWNWLIRSLRPNLCRARGYNPGAASLPGNPGEARAVEAGKGGGGAETFWVPEIDSHPAVFLSVGGSDRLTDVARPFSPPAPPMACSRSGRRGSRDAGMQGCRDGCALLPAPP